MASTSFTKEELPIEKWQLAKYGISLLINNRSTEAQELFKLNPDSIQMAAGYSFTTFMDALMSFEDEKLQLALATLRETEKKCATDIGWLKSVKTKVFGTKNENLADTLESQIILADTQVCVAILTFLQQEFSGYLKGGWVLRKAWKVYQHTYTEIIDLYKLKIGTLNLPEPTDFTWTDNCASGTRSLVECTQKESACAWNVPTSDNPIPSQSTSPKNGYNPNLSISHSHSSYAITNNSQSSTITRSISSLATDHTRMSNSRSAFSLLTPISNHLSYLTSSLTMLTTFDRNYQSMEIEPETVARLMSSVCFGYGVLQLGISLLPPSLLKFTSFLGFGGNRTSGISNLMYSRKGSDMRAPLATLALLWYHTIVRPFYALDGNNVKAGIEAANLLMQESEQEYGQSALFLYFKGRIHRLDSNIPKALESFQLAVDNSPQREIKLLALHDVGWCHLIQLDYEQAKKTFSILKAGSRWSRSFYTYLLVICSGSCNKLTDYTLIKELKELLHNSTQKGAQLEVFMQRRVKVFPETEDLLNKTTDIFWKILVYELLFLWNTLPSCNASCNNEIILDCGAATQEPMPGLAMLIQGESFNIQGLQDEAIASLRNCLSIRAKTKPKDDVHVCAFAEYALGALLIRNAETREEGKSLLHHASSQYKDYDFDNKLHVRLEIALKQVVSPKNVTI